MRATPPVVPPEVVTRWFRQRADSAGDPLGLQVFRQTQLEYNPSLGPQLTALSEKAYGRPTPWHPDPIGDKTYLVAPRLTHRYPYRALVHLTDRCAITCRFCFRKQHLHGEERDLYAGSTQKTQEYLLDHPEIRELIFTGGDPLSLGPDSFFGELESFRQIPSVRIWRFHTRTLTAMPLRFNESFWARLSEMAAPAKVVLVNHVNHIHEVSPETHAAWSAAKRVGITLLNQSVLLKGINDSVGVLEELFQGLYEAGVPSFYLHHPDWVPETFGYRISLDQGRSLFHSLRGRISGPALPQYVVDLPQGLGKVSAEGGHWKELERIREGGLHGVLYEVGPLPQLRISGRNSTLYLDIIKD